MDGTGGKVINHKDNKMELKEKGKQGEDKNGKRAKSASVFKRLQASPGGKLENS